MDIYKGEVLLGGSLMNTVHRNDLTAAEILILRAVHGDDAVRGLEFLEQKNRQYQLEYDRLVKKYGRRKVESSFPGARPVLPQSLTDVGIIIGNKGGHVIDEVIARGPNNPHRKTKKQQRLEALGAEESTEEGD